MADYNLLMPKMGESVIEATILTWHKKVGDQVSENEIILEVATDKVDSEVPSPVSGVIKKLLHDVNETVAVGDPLAVIEVEGDVAQQPSSRRKETAEDEEEKKSPSQTSEKEEEKKSAVQTEQTKKIPEDTPEVAKAKTEEMQETPAEEKETKEQAAEAKPEQQETIKEVQKTVETPKQTTTRQPASTGNRYYSPLVLNIAQVENVSMQELESIPGSGADNRITKEDILEYIEQKKKQPAKPQPTVDTAQKQETKQQAEKPQEKKVEEKQAVKRESPPGENTEIIEMDRMRKLIAQHMVKSKQTSAHVSSIIECDVTNVVKWREKHKAAFQKREGFGLSYMPVFVEAITKAIRDYPMINISVDGEKIIRKKDINMGIATALESGNLIVPVIKNTDELSILGIALAMNEIVKKARTNTLQPDDISGGTYTITNFGTFGNIIGTPIINQPQVAIMGVGAITKKPVVIEVEGEDVIAIRHMMYLSHTYDHRVVDGMLGGLFVKKVAEYLENFDLSQEI